MANNRKKVEKAAKKYPKLFIALGIIVAVIIIVLIVLYVLKIGPFKPKPDEGGGGELSAGTVTEVAEADLSIHFLELGNKSNGDSVLIKCGNTEVLIDAGSDTSSVTALKTYIDGYCTDGKLEYVISTHSDADHISAFFGSKSGSDYNGILYSYEVGTFIQFAKSGDDGNGKPLYTEKGNETLFKKYCDAVTYVESRGTAVYTAAQCYDQTDGAKRQYYLDENEKISINILYNYYYYNASKDENNYSVVTLLTQELESGNKNYLFTGDLEEDGESKLVDYYKNVPSAYATANNVLPQVVLYKAGHHGSKTSSTSKLMAAIKPENVAVCCCCGAPEYTVVNDNTFPTQQMIDNIAPYTDKIYVTSIATGLPEKDEKGNYVSKSYSGYESMNGNIVFYYKSGEEGGELKLYCSNNTTKLKDTEWFNQNRIWRDK